LPLTLKPSEKVYFKDNPRISNAILKGLQIPVSFVEIGRYKPPTQIWRPYYYGTEIGDFTGSISGFNSFFLTLCNWKGEEIYKNLCLSTFYVANNKGKIFNHFYNQIDLSKSYIQCSSDPYGISPPTEPNGIIFDFIVKTKDIN
jgi:hypothetical protein